MLSALVFLLLLGNSLNISCFGTLQHRSKRDGEKWNSEDIFLCEVDRNDSIGFSLTCDPKLACELTSFSPYKTKITGSLLDLDSLTDNCTQPFYPSSTSYRHSSDGQFRPFVLRQAQIVQLTIPFTNFTEIPAGYFCKLTNMTTLTISHETIRSTSDLGFHEVLEGCAIPLENLKLFQNHIQILNNASFLAFPGLISLDLSLNNISEIEENAFEALENLKELQLNKNSLKSLPEGLFGPLKSLLRLKIPWNRLTGSGLSNLQSLPKLELLDLSGNSISQVGEQDFAQLKNLRELDLSGNQLTFLGGGIPFLVSLETLDMSSNRLSEVPESTFGAMPKLSRLDLSNNRITALPVLSLSAGTVLKELDLSRNNLSRIPLLVNLYKAGIIDLCSNKFTRITAEDSDILCNITDLKTLKLCSNRIEEIHPDAFACRNNPKIVNLDDNRLTNISDLLENAKVTNLTVSKNQITQFTLANLSPSINELDLSKNAITDFSGIHPSNYDFDNGTALKVLILSSNSLQNISNKYFPKTLEKLQLDANKISSFSFPELPGNKTARTSVIPPNLRVIDLTSNNFQFACDLIIYMLTHKPAFNFKLSYNPLQCPCELELLSNHTAYLQTFFINSRTYQYSDRCFTKYANITLDPFELHTPKQFSCSSKLLRRLKHPICQCNLNSKYIEMCKLPCPEPCHCYINSAYDVQVTNCTLRSLEHVPEQPAINPLAEYLYMDHNDLRYLGPSSLASHFMAKELYFQNNRLTELHPEAFKHVPEVLILNLAYNLLKQLPSGVFRHLGKITEIDLSNNKIFFFFQDTFKPMHRLEFLYLHGNSLQNLSVWDMHDIEPSQPFHLTLHKNPWSCECNYVTHFRNWLQNFSHIVDDASNVSCTMDTGQVLQIPLISFNSSHCFSAAPVFRSFGSLTLWSSLTATLLFLTVVCVLVFIYRAEVQVLVYSRYGVRIFHQSSDEDDANKFYDAFLAYSSFDEEFVVETLLPNLEQIDNPYRMCIHERDFLVGAIITESILEAVEKSRRTIVLLSDHFVNSGWCRFEFKTAHLQMLNDRCSRVIVVILGDMPQNLDPEMELYIKTNTYLTWGDRMFWKKLYYALPDRNRPPNKDDK